MSEGNARLAEASVAEAVAAALDATDKHVSFGGAAWPRRRLDLRLVDELRIGSGARPFDAPAPTS